MLVNKHPKRMLIAASFPHWHQCSPSDKRKRRRQINPTILGPQTRRSVIVARRPVGMCSLRRTSFTAVKVTRRWTHSSARIPMPRLERFRAK
jgi:hypothetical protein